MSSVSPTGYWGGWGSRFMNDAALVLSQLCVVLSSLIIWFFSALTFFGEPLKRDDHVNMAVGFGLGAALLLLGLLPALALRCSAWVVVLGLVLAALCLAATVLSVQNAANAEPERFGSSDWWHTAVFFFVVPTSWPVFLLLAWTPFVRRRRVRGSSSPEPRPLQVR